MKIKNVNDYLDWMKQLYPKVSKSDIKTIINYGLRLFYYLNSCGGDICITDHNEFWIYSGYLTKDSLKHASNYINKLTIKLRILYRRKKIPWDGYYYFALNDDLYNYLISLKAKRGRPKKTFIYGDIVLYKILDECKLRNFTKKYIFRVPYLEDFGLKVRKKNYTSDKAELIIKRDSELKFKDILISSYNYECINEKRSN